MSANPVRHVTQQPLDDEERELMDPDNWNWEQTVEGKTIGTPGAVIEVRFTREEFLALTRLAQQTGVGPVEYTRQTMLRHISDHDEHEELKPRRLA